MYVSSLSIRVAADTREDITAEVDRLLREGRFSQGRNVEAFESDFADLVGTRHAIAVANGTVALEATFRAVGCPGGTVLVPANTNFAVYVAALRAGCHVELVDVDPKTLSPDPDQVTAALKRTAAAAVVLVHMGGLMSPRLRETRDVAARAGAVVVEDCSHAHASTLNGTPAGATGIAGTFSFFATKVMTTGEGGMVVTSDDVFAEEVRILRNMGKRETWRSYHERLTGNLRLNEFAAVLGRHLLKDLAADVQARREVAARYSEAFRSTELASDIEVLEPWHPYSGYKYVAMLPHGVSRSHVKTTLLEEGIHLPGEIYEVPLHLQPVLIGRHVGERYPGAELACERQVCLPIYPTLTAEEVKHVVRRLTEVVARARSTA
jgi:dTDP-4-amino-4,6-dideoxygalactose transaminase